MQNSQINISQYSAAEMELHSEGFAFLRYMMDLYRALSNQYRDRLVLN